MCRAETDDDSSMEIGDDETAGKGTTNAAVEPMRADAPKICSDVLFMMLEIIKKSKYKTAHWLWANL